MNLLLAIEAHLEGTSLALNAGLVGRGGERTYLAVCYDCWDNLFGGSVPAFTVLERPRGPCQFCGRTIEGLPLEEKLWPEMVRIR